MFFVGNNNICHSNHVAHHRFRFFTPLPKVSSVIQNSRYRQSALACLTHRLECQFRRRGADGGRDSTDVEPCASLECALPIDDARRRVGYRAMFTIVYDSRRALISTSFKEINTEAAVPSN